MKTNNRDVSGKNRILHQRQCEGAPHTRTGMARDDADAPGATSFSVTLGDARVVATDVPAALRTRHFERARGNGHATRTPSQVAATSTPDGVGLLAYVVGGDVEVTRIRGTDGAPSDAARLRLSSAFDDADDDDDAMTISRQISPAPISDGARTASMSRTSPCWSRRAPPATCTSWTSSRSARTTTTASPSRG